MHRPSYAPTVRAAISAALFMFCAVPAAAQQFPASVEADVNESFKLLRTTSYRPVDDQTILDGARTALSDAAKKHGAVLTIPSLRASGNDEETTTALDQAIRSAAEAAHATSTEFAYAAIAGMAKAVGDRYTQFFTPEEFKEFNQALDPQQISGIGVMIEPDSLTHCILLSYVIPGTPADRSGLQAGDIITAIDGTSTKSLATENASKLLRGKPGTTVRLDVERSNASLRTLVVARSEVQPPTVQYKMLPDEIGYISVLAFGRATPSEFDVALGRVKDAGARAIVLDLRNDGGGYVDSALDISSRFIDHKPLLTVQERGLPDSTYRAQDDMMIALPTTILVNGGTASASEITAGALQDDGVGLLMGTRTFGKGVMQTLTPLPDGAAIKITTAHYLTPRKRDINLRGIDPDVRVDENRDARFGDLDRDAQLRAAITMLQKKIADTHA